MKAVRSRLTLIMGLGLGMACFATPALADAVPTADVLVIQASNCATPFVDPKITEKPNMGYTCYSVVGKQSLSLTAGSPSKMTLPNGRTFQITYNGTVDKSSPTRHKYNASISKPDNSGFMTLADVNVELGKKVNVGGWNYNNGVLINQVSLR